MEQRVEGTLPIVVKGKKDLEGLTSILKCSVGEETYSIYSSLGRINPVYHKGSDMQFYPVTRRPEMPVELN